MTTSPRVWLVAMALALACVLLVRPAGAAEAPPTPGGSMAYGCNPATDKTCFPEGAVVLPSGGIDLDGDGDEDELPQFDPHFTILGHAN